MSANLITRIAARIDATFDVPAEVRDAAAEELATIARNKKMSAAKLSAQVIEDTLTEFMPDEDEGTMTDEINAEHLESIREGMAAEDDSNVAALKAQDLTPADEPAPAKATKARKANKDDAPTESRKGAHADCTHEVTKAARARCRRERAKALAVAA
ncbi:hypothetical protein FND50_12665 [Rhodococcus sp. WB9]|uniref:hypothetical protein n=1 Tax=Rhodococcus sp. WB9 TaxID=2594007 RepID=UPI00118713FA|nr:hypothetical protein [Rhodococcus sp. WB9]QDQ91586.1 hypothetical protein FND50_12665 [Rhodococcus sp. WB9]